MTCAGMLNKILLVDDDRVTNLMHKRQITRCGLARKVDITTDGQAALEFLDGLARAAIDPPEMILLDINMPRMNGFEFLSEYARRPQNLRDAQRVILVSTSALHRDVVRAEEDPNVHEFVGKPLSDAELKRLVDDYCASAEGRGTGSGDQGALTGASPKMS